MDVYAYRADRFGGGVAKQNVRNYPGGEGEIRTLGRAFDPTTV